MISVTGANGFIGREAVRQLEAKNSSIINLIRKILEVEN